MPYTFTRQPLTAGLYEPEGIYLGAPMTGEGFVLQSWGQHPDFYADFQYNGVPLRGYPGIAFYVPTSCKILAVDDGRVTEVSYERGGFEKYIKLQHRWGESLYAFVHTVQVDPGQMVKRSAQLATTTAAAKRSLPQLHLSIRVVPYNRFDGWGGFSDPMPYLPPEIAAMTPMELDEEFAQPIAMAHEFPGIRRP